MSRKQPPPPPPGFTVVASDNPPPPPDGFQVVGRVAPTGELHDGDTFRLDNGANARLFGVDAFELNQTGRSPTGAVVPLGQQARSALAPFARPDATVTPTGASTYGRPVATLDRSGDAGTALLDQGLAMAGPEYLRGDQSRLSAYMEAERQARLNRRGAWGDTFQTPSSFRHGAPDPWARPSDNPATYGQGATAYFWDDPTPFQGLRPDIASGYQAIFQDRNSTPEDLLAYAQANGFHIDPEQTRKAYEKRATATQISSNIDYVDTPRVLTDMHDGRTGAAARAFADPFNLLDEAGALVDSLGGTSGRENVWSSDRRFGDIYANNLDQNRSILAHDEATYPHTRFGGQLVGGLVVPGLSLEGVGFAAARDALQSGATRMAAQEAARAAVRNRLIAAGGAEGAVAGAGGGETLRERAIGTAVGGVTGATLGGVAGTLGRAAVERASAWLASARAARRAAGVTGKRTANAADEVPPTAHYFRPGPDAPSAWPDRAPQGDAAPAPAAPETGPFGPVHRDLADNYPAALDRLRTDQSGEVPGAIQHPELGPIDLIWGDGNYGLSKITARHPEVVENLPDIIESLPVLQRPGETGNNRFVLGNDQHRAVVSPDFEGDPRRWLVTAYERVQTPGEQTSRRAPQMPDGGSTGDGAGADIARAGVGDNATPPSLGATSDPAAGNLWAASRADLERMLADKSASDRDKLVRALGEDGAREFERLDRARNSMDTRRADAASEEFDRRFGNLTPEQERLVYGIGETDASADDIRQVLLAHDDLAMGGSDRDGQDWHGYVAALGARRATAADLAAVTQGEGDAGAQAAFVRLRGAYQALAEQGVSTAQIPGRMVDGMVSRGINPAHAAELVESFVADMSAAGGRRSAPMASEFSTPRLAGPSVEELGGPRAAGPADGGARPLLSPMNDADRLAAADRIAPGDLLPLPANTVDGVEEAARIEQGRYSPVRAPNENDVLSRDTVPSRATGAPIARRGPADLVTFLRGGGGVRDEGGDLAAAGVDNAPRTGMPFAGREAQIGPLVSGRGMSLDEAARSAWEHGYFPGHTERPTVNEFLDAVAETHSGSRRAFRLDDLPEVEAYHATQAERHAIEQAAAEGAPATRDNSQPASLADMDANAAPVRAYEEWGENAPDLAGNIRLDKLDSPQAIKRALVQVDRVSGGFDAARRGRITAAETERLASELNMTPDALLRRRKGAALNAEQALAARQILAKSGNELVNLAKRLRTRMDAGEATEAEQVAFRAAIVRHVAIQEQVAGATAEAGRALAQFRQAADSRSVRGEVLRGLIEQSGGSEGIGAAADAIVDSAADPARLNQVAENLASPKLKDKLVELWYNSLLSGPRTHVVNITSNLLTSLAQIPEHVAAAGVGVVRKALPGQADTDRVLFSETGARTLGFLQGAREGFTEFGRTMRTGRTRDFVTKVEAQEQEAIGGRLGSIVRTPTRMLSAEDELFKAMARRMELAGLAVRRARSEGLRGDAAKTRAGELIANPTPDMLDAAFDYGRYVTFQRPLGPVGNALTGLLNKWPAAKLFVPFVRTPTNLLKFAVERSPAAPVLREWRKEVAAGGARRDLAVARAMVGTSAVMMAVEAAANGHLTGGGPADESARRLMAADGWQPYSVKVGDRYYSYNRLDPFSTTLGMAADWVDLQSHMTDKQRQNVAGVLVASAMQNLSSKTWLEGMSKLGNLVSDPLRQAGSFARYTAGSVAVPALGAQVAQMVDPVQRDARTMLDAIRVRIPGASAAVPARRDVFGEERPGQGGIAALSPVMTQDGRSDPTISALVDAGVTISAPSRYVGGRELQPAEYDRYQTEAGRRAKARLDAFTRSPTWRTLGPDARKEQAEKLIASARRETRVELFGVGGGRRGRIAAPPPDLPPPPPGFTLAR